MSSDASVEHGLPKLTIHKRPEITKGSKGGGRDAPRVLEVSTVQTGWWLSHPSEKYESQLGWWNSQYIYIYIHGKIVQMFQTTNQQSIGMLPKITAWVLWVYVSFCHSFFGIARDCNHPGSKYRNGISTKLLTWIAQEIENIPAPSCHRTLYWQWLKQCRAPFSHHQVVGFKTK